MKLFLYFFLCPFFLFSQTQIGNDIDGEAAGDHSGWSVSLSNDGSMVAIGANGNDGNGDLSGHVRIYENQSGTWTQIGNDIDGEAAGDQSGYSVSLSNDGSVVAIGAPLNDDNGNLSGHVRIYENQSGTWTQIGNDIDGELAVDRLGFSVSLSNNGSLVAISSPWNDNNGNESGYVRIFENQSGTWTQVGNNIEGEAAEDRSGTSISLSSDGSIVAIGAYQNDGNGNLSGHARIYENQSGTWTQIGNDIDGEAEIDYFGHSVSLSSDGTIVAIGAIFNSGNGGSSGHVRIFKNQSGTWTQIGNDIDGEAAGDQSGYSVSLSSDGSVVAISANGNDGATGVDSGHVRIYKNQSGTWTQIGNDIDGEAAGDVSGWFISLSGNSSIVAIGTIFNDGNGADSGHVRVYDLSALLSSDEFVLSNFSMFPNPAKNIITIQLKGGMELEKVNIYNNLGQFISSTKENIINSSELSGGIYFVEIETNKGKASKKLIIE